MKTAEDIVGDYIINEDNSQSEVGFIPRPTDQRVNHFSSRLCSK